MTDLNTDTGAAPDDTNLSRAVLDPKDFAPPAEKPKDFGSDRHGLEQAADELKERRQTAEPKIKVRRMDRDARPLTSARDAAQRITLTRRIEDGERLMQATGARTGSAAEFIGATVRERAQTDGEPVRVEYQDGRPKDQRITAREAAADLAAYRTQTAPQEAAARDHQFSQIVELLNGDEELARQTLGEQQTPTEQPVEQQQPAQPDPAIIEARQRAEYAAQQLQSLHYLSRDELVLGARLEEIKQGIKTEFPDVFNMGHVARLSADKQARWNALQQDYAVLETQRQHAATNRENLARRIQDAHQAQQAAAQHEEQRAFAAWKSHQDQIVAKEVPEINDEQHGHEFRRAAQEVLKDYLQLTPETARNLNPVIAKAMHYSGFQKLLADAARYRLGVARAKGISSKPLPPVQRPGVSQPKSARAAGDVVGLIQRGDRHRPGSEKQIRNYAAAIAQARRARG